MKKNKKVFYYIALGEIFKEMGLRQVDARRKFEFDVPGDGYISRTGFQKLFHHPRHMDETTVNIVCNAMGLTPGDLWRKK